MRFRPCLAVFLGCASAATLSAQASRPSPPQMSSAFLVQKFVSDFDLTASSQEAEAWLKHVPHDVTALVVRMETAELQERQDVVLDSALHLCTLPSGEGVQKLASNRILQHAANTALFNSFVRRVKGGAAMSNSCTFNLRLALVAAASDGDSRLDLDHAALAAGLLTHFRIAGPFGKYNNVDFERRWAPENDQLAHQQYSGEGAPDVPQENQKKKPAAGKEMPHRVAAERFWSRDGMISLPEYLSGGGIYYAATDVELSDTQTSRIDVLAAGAYTIFIDGKQALLHDARYGTLSTRDAALVRLRAGHHRLVVKFTADASPLSVALHPDFQRWAAKAEPPPAMAKYVRELGAYFAGDLTAMERIADEAENGNAGSAQYVRALLYSAAEDHSPRADAAWKAVALAQPSALLARLKAAESAVARGQTDDARPDVMTILAERPQSEAALQLAFILMRSPTEAPALLGRLLELHPSCTRLADAVKFYSSIAEQDRARKLEQQLSGCAPESLQYARVLADAGRNGAAAAYLQQLLVRNPLHRGARRMLVEQLELSSQPSAARLQARQLRDLAPNARSYAHLADDASSAQDSKSQRATGFTQNNAFYAAYRRNGLEVVRKSAPRTFSGGSAVILLSDKVIELRADGGISVYTHRLTRPLNKDGIDRYGEISLPRGADLLELRTIKASGQIIEPELAQQKTTISMPALEIDDVIEEEYVTHFADPDQVGDTAFSHTFGSFAAPILYSRLVLLSPADAHVDVREVSGAPQPLVGENDGTVIRIWERDNIAQSLAESFQPPIHLLPTVSFTVTEKTRDRLRDELIDSTRSGLRVNEASWSLRLPQTASESDKARRLYRFVTTKIDSTGPDWAGNSAEETLQNGQGSRTSTLLALARMAGLKAGLILARQADWSCGSDRDLSCYTEPLVRFWFANGEIADVDAESEDLPFGTVPPGIEMREALFVPLLAEDEKKPLLVPMSAAYGLEKSVAKAELSFRKDDLLASLEIRLGASRAQEVRGLLRSAGQHELQAFLDQLALRIFPGATLVEGSVAHQDDVEQPLEITLRCTVPQFISRQGNAIDIDQLVPALGLRTLYAKAPARRFPLYIESLFFESTTFHLHLPDGLRVRALPFDFNGKSEFGEYLVRFAQSARQVDIHREFRIPVQVIAPEKYAAFVGFAQKIEEAERQRISLEATKDASAVRQYRVPPATGMLR